MPSDRHNNTTALLDGAGVARTAYEYGDYGQTATHHIRPNADNAGEAAHVNGASVNPFQYSGEYTDSSHKQHLGQRLYEPATTAFTTRDTADQFNLYAYANANPITLVDPTGKTASADVVQSGLLGFLGVVAAMAGFIANVRALGGGRFFHSMNILIAFVDVGFAGMQAADAVLDTRPGDEGFLTDIGSAVVGGTALATGLAMGLMGGKLAHRAVLGTAQVRANAGLWNKSLSLADRLNDPGEEALARALFREADENAMVNKAMLIRGSDATGYMPGTGEQYVEASLPPEILAHIGNLAVLNAAPVMTAKTVLHAYDDAYVKWSRMLLIRHGISTPDSRYALQRLYTDLEGVVPMTSALMSPLVDGGPLTRLQGAFNVSRNDANMRMCSWAISATNDSKALTTAGLGALMTVTIAGVVPGATIGLSGLSGF